MPAHFSRPCCRRWVFVAVRLHDPAKNIHHQSFTGSEHDNSAIAQRTGVDNIPVHSDVNSLSGPSKYFMTKRQHRCRQQQDIDSDTLSWRRFCDTPSCTDLVD